MSADFPLSFRHSFRSYQPDTLCLQSITPFRTSCKSHHTHFQRYSEPVPSQPHCFQSPAIATRHRMRFTSFTLGFGGRPQSELAGEVLFATFSPLPSVRHRNTNRSICARRVVLYTTGVALMPPVTFTTCNAPAGAFFT